MTPEPGHYVEPAFSPDGKLITYRKTKDGFLNTPLYGRDPGLYIVPVSGGAPKRVAKKGRQPMFGATNDRIFFTDTGEEEKRLLKSVTVAGQRGGHPPHLAERRRFRAVARRAVRRLDRALPGLCHAVRPIGPVDRHRAGRQSAAAVEGQRRRRRLDPFSGDGRTLYWSQGPNLYGLNLGTSGAFAGGKLGVAPLVAELGVDRQPSQAAAAASR